MSIKKIQTV